VVKKLWKEKRDGDRDKLSLERTDIRLVRKGSKKV